MRELTVADLRGAHDHFARAAVQIVNSGDDVMPQVFMVHMDDATPGKLTSLAALDPGLVQAALGSGAGAGKDLLMTLTRMALDPEAPPGLLPRDDRVDIVVWLSEVWMASHVHGDDRAPSERPDRREALQVAVHVHGYTYTSLSPITGTGATRHCAAKPLEVDGADHLYGRLTQQGMQRATRQ